jgi:Fe-S-cluster containining protein
MPPKGFKCKQCGHCCLYLEAAHTTVSATDNGLWELEGREDILEWTDPICDDSGKVLAYDIWIDPKTGEDVVRCPWLRKNPEKEEYICRIYDVKPRFCREYPESKEHADKTGCKGFED